MNFNKPFASFLAFSLYIFYASGTNAGPILDGILSSGVLHAGTTADWYEMTRYNENIDEYEGRDIDMYRELAKDLGVELEITKLNWGQYLKKLKAGEIHISGSAAIYPERLKAVAFSNSYAQDGWFPIVKDKKRFNSWGSLNKKNVKFVSLKGTVYTTIIEKHFPKAQIEEIIQYTEALEGLNDGKYDAFITTTSDTSYNQKHPYLKPAVRESDYRSITSYSVMLPPKDQEWINLVNSWIALKKDQGFFDDHPKLPKKKKRPYTYKTPCINRYPLLWPPGCMKY